MYTNYTSHLPVFHFLSTMWTVAFCPESVDVHVWILLTETVKRALWSCMSLLSFSFLLKKNEWFIFLFFYTKYLNFELEHFLGCYLVFFGMLFFYLLGFFLLFFCIMRMLYYEWMNVFQNKLCITVHLTTRQECLWVRHVTPHHSEYAYYLRSDSGVLMACGLLWSPAASALPELFHSSQRFRVCLLTSWRSSRF